MQKKHIGGLLINSKKQKMKIALIAYSISPFYGSEYAVAWDFVTRMAKVHELYVFYGCSKPTTIGKQEDFNEYAIQIGLKNVHFICVELPDDAFHSLYARLRKVHYILGFYFQYKSWHQLLKKDIEKWNEEIDFDVIHYLNPIGFKEPGYCWKIDKPYVWGPVQGVQNRPYALRKALNWKGKAESVIRYILHNYHLRYNKRLKQAIEHTDVLISALPLTQIQFKTIHGKESIYLPENGLSEMINTNPIKWDSNCPLNLIWVGEISQRKALIILLEALILLPKEKLKLFHLNVIGDGTMKTEMEEYCKRRGLNDIVNFHGKIERQEVAKFFSKSHLHIISSLGEATTTVLWEAMAHGVPTMTLDHCGMSGVICNDCGIKIPINSYNQVISDISNHLISIVENPETIEKLSEGVLKCSTKFGWDIRCQVFNDAYFDAISNYRKKNEL